jgi:hypothetical protein
MRDKRNLVSCPRGQDHLVRQPYLLLPNNTSPKNRKINKRKKKQKKNVMPTKESKLKLGILNRNQCYKFRKNILRNPTLPASPIGCLLITPADLSRSQKVQDRFCKSIIPKQIHRFQPLPQSPRLPRDSFHLFS